jgi:hypothetical protein
MDEPVKSISQSYVALFFFRSWEAARPAAEAAAEEKGKAPVGVPISQK